MAHGDSYKRIIETVFLERHRVGGEEVLFDREDLRIAAHALGVPVPENLGDIVYAFRNRRPCLLLGSSRLRTWPRSKFQTRLPV